MACAGRVELSGVVEDQINANPDQLGMTVKNDGNNNDDRHRSNLDRNNGEVGAEYKEEGQQHANECRYAEVYYVGAEHIAIFRLKY